MYLPQITPPPDSTPAHFTSRHAQPRMAIFVDDEQVHFFRRLALELPELLPSVRVVWLLLDSPIVTDVIALLESHRWRVVLTGYDDATPSQLLEAYLRTPVNNFE